LEEASQYVDPSTLLAPLTRSLDTAFKQQRLKAWQPILTPKTVLPTLFIIGILFAPIGGLLIWGSSKVSEMTFDYTECENLPAATSPDSLQFSALPSNKYSYHLTAADSNAKPNAPRYAYLDNTNNATVTDVSQKKQCIVEFEIPANLTPSVLFYYKLTNFYQNHRRYVKSLNSDQLKGKYVSPSDLDDSDCKPVSTIDDVAIYPCGLIANSYFNGSSPFDLCTSNLICPIDTFSNPVLVNPGNSEEPEQTYTLSAKGIAWPGEAKKYVASPIGDDGYPDLASIRPPPNWAERYPDNYTEQNPPPNLREDERFQNWMRTAGLPTFTKLYGRNDDQEMARGTYRIVIGLSQSTGLIILLVHL